VQFAIILETYQCCKLNIHREEPSFSVRRLSSQEADTFRSIRLESLQQDPEAFASTFERELNESRQHFSNDLIAVRFLEALWAKL
jgi:hypothetical protein